MTVAWQLHAKMHVNITQRDIKVMFHSRKSLLYNLKILWVKKERNSFVVTMGAYNGVEMCHIYVVINREKL